VAQAALVVDLRPEASDRALVQLGVTVDGHHLRARRAGRVLS
jgi:hypothetical protein